MPLVARWGTIPTYSGSVGGRGVDLFWFSKRKSFWNNLKISSNGQWVTKVLFFTTVQHGIFHHIDVSYLLIFNLCRVLYKQHTQNALPEITKWNCMISKVTQIARFTWPTWDPPGSCRPQVGPTLAPWTLLSSLVFDCDIRFVFVGYLLVTIHQGTLQYS